MAYSQELLPAMAACALGFGMVPGLLSAVRTPLGQRLALADARTARLTSLVSLTLVPLMVVSGWLIDRVGVYPVLISGSLVLAVGLLALAVSRMLGQALGAVLLVGAGAAAVGVGSVVLMPAALGFQDQPAAATNLGTIGFTLGTMLTPRLFAPCLRRWGLRQSLLGAALAALVPGLLVALAPWSSGRLPANSPEVVLHFPALWLAAAVLFFYLPLEHALAAGAPPYFTEMGHSPRLAGALITGFWLGFLAMRVGIGCFLGQNNLVIEDAETWIVLFLALFAAIVLGNMLGTTSPRSATVGLVLLGACLGPIFPTLVGMVYRLFPEGPGTACGMVCALGSFGGMALPPLAGISARKERSARDALWFPMALTLVLAAAALVLTLIQGV